MTKEWWEDDYVTESSVYPFDKAIAVDLREKNSSYTYSLTVPQEYHTRPWTDQEKQWLRPIAETLALLDGNGFLGGQDWYETYLPQAAAIFYRNGGIAGWAGEASWIQDMRHETPAVQEAYLSWRTLKALSHA